MADTLPIWQRAAMVDMLKRTEGVFLQTPHVTSRLTRTARKRNTLLEIQKIIMSVKDEKVKIGPERTFLTTWWWMRLSQQSRREQNQMQQQQRKDGSDMFGCALFFDSSGCRDEGEWSKGTLEIVVLHCKRENATSCF